jgi:hypothetical protein
MFANKRLGSHAQEGSAIQLQVKTILNRIQAFVGFVYQDVRWRAGQGNAEQIEITVAPHGGIRGRCSACRRPAPGYERLPERRWLFVPCGESQPGFAMRHDGLSAPSTVWRLSTYHGATASVR